jgi:ABC-type multidrug transport system fused ATPase/permease subunit
MSGNRSNAHQQRFEAILARYRDKEPRPGAELRHLRRLWREYIYPIRWRLFIAIITTMLVALTPYAYSFILKELADVALAVGKPIPPQEMSEHYRWLFILFLANTLLHFPEVFCTYKARQNISLMGQTIVYELRKVLHEKLQSLPLSFFDRTQTGKLLSVVLDDVATVQASIGMLGINIFTYVTTILVGGIIMFSLNWRMGIIVTVALPFYVWNFRHYRPRIREGNIAARRANTSIYNEVEERISGINTVKVFGREKAEVRTFTELTHNLARLMMYIVYQTSWQSIIASTVSALSSVGILYYGFIEYRYAVINENRQ